jgi:hypothetical protein
MYLRKIMRRTGYDKECTCIINDGYYDSICPIHNPEGYAHEKERNSPRGRARDRRVVKALIKHAKGLGW